MFKYSQAICRFQASAAILPFIFFMKFRFAKIEKNRTAELPNLN